MARSIAFSSIQTMKHFILLVAVLSLTISVVDGLATPATPSSDPAKTATQEQQKTADQQHKRPRIPVLRYEDDWVCVNKPAGISVHRSAGTRRNEVTLRSLLKKQLARKIFPVHRLDHRTSGAILFAFDSATCGQIHDQLRKGTKDYIALLRGEWKYDTNRVTIDEPLKVDGVKKEAVTEFELIASSTYRDMPCSLVRCYPQTGRTHQIRRHAYHLGHPIIGDSQHGDSRVNRMWRTQRGLNRLALHCLSIQLAKQEGPCIAPVSPEFRVVLEEDEAMWQSIIDLDPRFVLEPVDERGGTFGRNYRSQGKEETDESTSPSAVTLDTE